MHTEATLEAQLVKRVRLLGGQVHKLAPTTKGIPDRMVMLPGGQVYLVEMKTSVGRLSAAQRLWHARAAELGVHVHVLSGADEVTEWVRARYQEVDDRKRNRRWKSKASKAN